MARPLTTYDNIAIAEIVIYAIFLLGGIYLCFKHGIARSSGWRFLVILALARIIGSALRLATISDPTNTSLYIGWQTLNGVGLGPLVLMLLALLSRIFDSINRQGHVVIKPIYQRLIEILMLVAMVLLIVGGVNSDYSLNGGKPSIDYSGVSQGGIIVMIVVLVFICFEALLAFRSQGYVAQGEHRILVAVLVSLPFVAVRLVYSCVLILGAVTSSAWLYLGAGVIMEILVVLACEVVGFTLDKAPPKPSEETDREMQTQHGAL